MRSCLISCTALALVLLAVPAFAEDKPAKPKVVTVAVGQTVRLQMSTKRPIKTVVNDHELVIRVQPVPDDPTSIAITGLMPGRARLTLTDIDGKVESRDLGKPSGK
jgi:hypothetical protein